MSHENEGQQHEFKCDACGSGRLISSDSFTDAWEALKEDGWRCFKNDDDEWEHRCPRCRGKS